MKVSVVIPVFNEAKTIKSILHRVERSLNQLVIQKNTGIHDWQIIIVNDGSTDETKSILKKYRQPKFQVINLKQNQGKGAALRAGFERVDGEIIITQDADLEYDPKYYFELLQPLITDNRDVVYGSRLGHLDLNLKTVTSIKLPLHFVSNKLLSWLTSALYGQKLTDMETGYKVFRKKVLDDINLTTNSFDIEVELTSKVIKSGYQIYEVPISTNPRGYDEGKKIGFKDGIQAIVQLIRYRLEAYHLAVLAILLLAFIMRFENFPNRYGLWSDQARDVFVGRVANETRTPPLIGSFSSAGPFTFGPIWYYYSMLMDLSPGNHMNYWIGMGLLSTLMTLGIMWLARQIIGRFASLAAGVLSAISLATIESSLGSSQHSLVPIMVTGMLVAMVAYIRHKRTLTLFLVGLFFSLAVNAHYQGIYLIPLLAIFLLFNWPKLKDWLWFLLALLIPTLPMIWFDVTHKWWNLREIIDYYRFGQFRIYVPNRWLTYAGVFWPDYWSRVVGGGLVFAYFSMAAGACLFWWQLAKRNLKKEMFLLVVGFFAAFVWFRFFRAERTYGYITFSIPFIFIIVAWVIDHLRKIDTILGVAVLGLFVFGSFSAVANNNHRNIYQVVKAFEEELDQQVPGSDYAIYDHQFTTSGCSISLSLILDDNNKSTNTGYPIGACTKGSCPPHGNKLVSGSTGGFECQLIDLSSLSQEDRKEFGWVLVSPEEVHRMTVEWWKTEPKLLDNL